MGNGLRIGRNGFGFNGGLMEDEWWVNKDGQERYR